MKKNLEQLKAQYSSCPSSEREYEIDRTEFTLTRIFTEERDLDKLISELAESRANREMRGNGV